MGWIHLKTNKRELGLHLPNCWPDVTFKQWLQLRHDYDGKDLLKLISIMSGKSLKDIQVLPSSTAKLDSLQSIKFIYDDTFDFDMLPIPEIITIGKKDYLIPKDVMKETFGQKVMLMQYISDPDFYIDLPKKNEDDEQSREYSKLLHIAAAIYMQPLLDDAPFDADKAEGYFDKFMKMPVTDVYPIGSFFLTRSRILKKPGRIGLNLPIIRKIRNVLSLLRQRMSKGLTDLKA